MRKTEQLDELFGEWRHHHSGEGFCPDGIVDEDRWDNAEIKVLFVAKETNCYDGDLRKLIREAPHGWKVAGTWAHALQFAGSKPAYAEAAKMENIGAAILSSAILNIKKQTGGRVADMERILAAGKRDEAFIRREIAIIKPQVVVCCGTFAVLRKIFPELSRLQPIDPDGKCYSWSGSIWINFCHFGARFRHDMMYYTLQSLFARAARD